MVQVFTIKICPRGREKGRPFTEILYTWVDGDGCLHHALSRCPWVIEDTPYNRSREAEAFKRRNQL